MKRLFLTSLFAASAVVVPLLSCEAGDGATTVGEKKNATTNAAEQQKKVQVKHHSHVAQTDLKDYSGSCRDNYCRHAAGTPWWPGAPGD